MPEIHFQFATQMKWLGLRLIRIIYPKNISIRFLIILISSSIMTDTSKCLYHDGSSLLHSINRRQWRYSCGEINLLKIRSGVVIYLEILDQSTLSSNVTLLLCYFVSSVIITRLHANSLITRDLVARWYVESNQDQVRSFLFECHTTYQNGRQ